MALDWDKCQRIADALYEQQHSVCYASMCGRDGTKSYLGHPWCDEHHEMRLEIDDDRLKRMLED